MNQIMQIRKSDDRGYADHGWLKARHSFSFGTYHDPHFMGYKNLRVINEDRISPSGGFPTHGHQNMEIITYMISGSLVHKDSMGNSEILKTGEVQHMSAGSGIRHSEFNASDSKPAHLLQIWIEPNAVGITPKYEQKLLSDFISSGELKAVATPDENDGALQINANAKLFAGKLENGNDIKYLLSKELSAWIQIIKGDVTVNGNLLEAGDGASLSSEGEIQFRTQNQGEFLLFELT